jgi:hypothetical protein
MKNNKYFILISFAILTSKAISSNLFPTPDITGKSCVVFQANNTAGVDTDLPDGHFSLILGYGDTYIGRKWVANGSSGTICFDYYNRFPKDAYVSVSSASWDDSGSYKTKKLLQVKLEPDTNMFQLNLTGVAATNGKKYWRLNSRKSFEQTPRVLVSNLLGKKIKVMLRLENGIQCNGRGETCAWWVKELQPSQSTGYYGDIDTWKGANYLVFVIDGKETKSFLTREILLNEHYKVFKYSIGNVAVSRGGSTYDIWVRQISVANNINKVINWGPDECIFGGTRFDPWNGVGVGIPCTQRDPQVRIGLNSLIKFWRR